MPRQKIVQFMSSVANNGTVDIQPGSGVTWLVFSIESGGTFELRRVSDSNTITMGRVLGRVHFEVPIVVTSGAYLRLVNVSGTTQHVAVTYFVDS
jgi:hypothetical protein